MPILRRSTGADADPAAAHGRPDGHVLLDVREHHEFAAGHAPGAVHVPLGELSLERLPRAEVVYCVCRSGGRSAQATAALRRAGVDARNVRGGMAAWHRSGLPVQAPGGRSGQVV